MDKWSLLVANFMLFYAFSLENTDPIKAMLYIRGPLGGTGDELFFSIL